MRYATRTIRRNYDGVPPVMLIVLLALAMLSLARLAPAQDATPAAMVSYPQGSNANLTGAR